MFNWILIFFPKKSIDNLEKRRITYALWVILGLLLFFILVSIIHSACNMSPVHFIADFIGVCGTCLSLYWVKSNRLEKALKTIVITLLAAVFIYGPLVDYTDNTGEIMFLRLYVTLFALEAALLLMVSFYIAILNFAFLAILFSLLLALHFGIILNKNGWETLTPEMISYGIIAVLAINISCFIASLMIRFNNDLVNKINADNQKIYEQNIHLESEVRKRTQQLQSSNENLQQFAHIVSHELKEPLRTLSGFSNLLQKRLKTLNVQDNNIEEYTKFIQTGTTHMAALVDEMLIFSSVQQTQKMMAEIDMNALVQLVLKQIDNLIQETNAKIVTTSLPNAYGEGLLIFQLIQNLIVNAIRYKSEERQVVIHISGELTETQTIYAINDNSIGIPNDKLTAIFNPLVRLNNTDSTNGTGMGLSICKKIVEAHNGVIYAKSEENVGSTFYFVLPKREFAMAN